MGKEAAWVVLKLFINENEYAKRLAHEQKLVFNQNNRKI